MWISQERNGTAQPRTVLTSAGGAEVTAPRGRTAAESATPYLVALPLPDDGLPVTGRSAVRLVVLDAGGKLLLFHTHDPGNPDLGTWWELPGGGIEPGETCHDTAIRELREETGIIVTRSQVGPPSWRRRASFRYRHERRLQDEVIVTVRLTAQEPGIDESQRLDYEKEDYFGYRWWPVQEIVSSSARFYPGKLPALLGTFLDGQNIDEPFELWS